MQIEVTEPSARPYRVPFNSLRWSGIFAGLVVGIATNLFLLLLGAATGLAVFDVGESSGSAALAAGLWNAVCMVVAAFCGGYVAARTAGMRRASDGALHGVVAWGLTMLVSALMATSATGATLGSLFGKTAGHAATAEALASVSRGDRQEAVSVLESRLGLSAEQASRIVDQALVLTGREESASPEGRAAAEHSLRAASVASLGLSLAILLSLLAAIGGGLVGARGTRRVVRTETYLRAPSPEAPPGSIAHAAQ